jgi:signal transduction histidine kinase/DNA-binding response OmpR family regulator
LREGHRLLTLAEGLAHVGHWRFDAASHSFDCSPQASLIADLPRTRQCDPGDMLGLVHAGDKRTVMRTLASARTTGAPAECSARLVLADELRHVRLVAQAEHDDRGALVGMFGVMRDVTEEEIIQAEIIRARDAAQEAARAKSDFLATMSHEIRTPMTGVLGMIDLLRSQCAEEDRDRYLATLKQSADLLMTVLDDILDFSRIEAGKIEFEEHDFDLEELMQSTLDLFDGAASQKGLLLSLEHDRAGPSIVRSDAVRLQQIVSNLLSNAIKFTAVGRVTVVLTARPVDEDRQSWRIEVRDTGIGIAPAKLGTLFEPFVQAEAATSRRFGGTGLGLAISRRLVDAMGGKVGVRSRVGRGSTFWLELTLPNGALGAADRTPAPQPVAERALDLLVAEDNPVNQMIISAILRRFGHSVTCVENGRQAVDLAGLRHFDCILMDMQMPEMDGIAATRAIRSSGGPCATTPIIALTADASSERRRFYDGAGLTDFLTKPIDRKALAERLAALTRPAPIAEQVAPAADPPFSATLDEIDLDRFNELRDVLGSSRVRDLLDLLTLELNRCPARIRELVRHGDLDGARAEAHGLKGAASNVGAIALGRVAAAIEAAMNETHLGSQLEELDDQARRTVKAIAALR